MTDELHVRDEFDHEEKFSRFKYAEERAHGLDQAGVQWNLTRGPDEVVHEDGEVYRNKVYVVTWRDRDVIP